MIPRRTPTGPEQEKIRITGRDWDMADCGYIHGSIGTGRARNLTARALQLEALGLINLREKPVPAGAQFPDYRLVALTDAGQAALADVPTAPQTVTEKTREPR